MPGPDRDWTLPPWDSTAFEAANLQWFYGEMAEAVARYWQQRNFKWIVAELVVREVLKLEACEPKSRHAGSPEKALVLGKAAVEDLPTVLKEAMDAYKFVAEWPTYGGKHGKNPCNNGMPVIDFLEALKARVKPIYAAWRDPWIARGLLKRYKRRRLSRRHLITLTPDGQEMQRELSSSLAWGQYVLCEEGIEQDAERALGYLAHAGYAALLVKDIHLSMQHLDLDELARLHAPEGQSANALRGLAELVDMTDAVSDAIEDVGDVTGSDGSDGGGDVGGHSGDGGGGGGD